MALSLDWISATDSRSCTAPLREGKEGRPGGGGRAPAGGRSPVQARNYPTATWPYWGGAACAAHPQTPGVLAPCRRAAETRTFRRSGGQGELPGNCRAVDEDGAVFGWAGAVIRRRPIRAAGGLLPILQGAGACLTVAARIIWRILSLIVPPGGAACAMAFFPHVIGGEILEATRGTGEDVPVVA